MTGIKPASHSVSSQLASPRTGQQDWPLGLANPSPRTGQLHISPSKTGQGQFYTQLHTSSPHRKVKLNISIAHTRELGKYTQTISEICSCHCQLGTSLRLQKVSSPLLNYLHCIEELPGRLTTTKSSHYDSIGFSHTPTRATADYSARAVLYCTDPYCTVLYCTEPYCTVLYTSTLTTADCTVL